MYRQSSITSRVSVGRCYNKHDIEDRVIIFKARAIKGLDNTDNIGEKPIIVSWKE